jgi:hypothetical protein
MAGDLKRKKEVKGKNLMERVGILDSGVIMRDENKDNVRNGSDVNQRRKLTEWTPLQESLLRQKAKYLVVDCVTEIGDRTVKAQIRGRDREVHQNAGNENGPILDHRLIGGDHSPGHPRPPRH